MLNNMFLSFSASVMTSPAGALLSSGLPGYNPNPDVGTYNPYVPWNPAIFDKGIQNLISFIGPAFNIGVWIFFIMAGVFLIAKIVDSLVP